MNADSNKSNLKELKEILSEKDSKSKSELVNQLLSKLPLNNEINKEINKEIILNKSNYSDNMIMIENKNLRADIDELKNLITELKNENSRLKMQLNHNISDSTNANTTVNHINVDIHNQEDLHKFMNFYKEVSQGNEPPATYNLKPNSF